MTSTKERELGYQFERFSDPHAVGYRAVDLNVYSVPTEQHFDPDHVIVPTVNIGGTIVHTTIVHPWHGKARYQIAFGNIYIRDRKNRVVELFSLGGEAHITPADGHTHCRITSTAPIFHLASPIGVGDENRDSAIVDEIEVLIAKRRVHWLNDDIAYEQRLTALDPRTLYVASLKAVCDQMVAMPDVTHGDHYFSTIRRLHRALDCMAAEGVNVDSIPKFETLI